MRRFEQHNGGVGSKHATEPEALAQDQSAIALREEMVAQLIRHGVIESGAVAAAMASVPRHVFVPHISLKESYADEAVIVRVSPEGRALSSISQPTMVARMLERLDVQMGHRVLEIGTGTGYNVALLASLVGPNGLVVSVELEERLGEEAREKLTELGINPVELVVGDGREGWPPRAPYDRIIVTAGADDVAEAWTEQLVEGGRVVLPIVDGYGSGWVHVLEKREGELVGQAEMACGFLPIRNKAQDG